MLESMTQRISRLRSLHECVGMCEGCALHEEAGQPTAASGLPSDIMVVGRNPGRQERDGGEPFIGPCGKFLDEWLGICGLGRNHVYITNLVKCFTAANREPEPECAQKCLRLFLGREVELVRPKAILLFGDYVTRMLCGKRVREAGPYTHSRHRFFSEKAGHDCYVFFCYHPGVCVRGSAEWADRCRQGFQRVARGLKKVL